MRYSSSLAIQAHASASAKALWCCVRSYPQYAATVWSWWSGKRLPSFFLEALQVQKN